MYTGRVQRFCSGPNSPMVAFVWNFLVQIQNLKRILVWVENEEALHIARVRKLEEHLQILPAPCNTIYYKYILDPSVFGYDKLWPTALRAILLPVGVERLFERIVVRSDVTSKGFGVGLAVLILDLPFEFLLSLARVASAAFLSLSELKVALHVFLATLTL